MNEIKSLIMLQIKVKLKVAMLEEIDIKKGNKSKMFAGTQEERLNMAIAQKTVARAIISMFPEIGKKPDQATDDDCIKLLKKYISQEKERLLYSDKHLTQSDVEGLKPAALKKLVTSKMAELGDDLTSPLIEVAQDYLPEQASEEEIVKWINENIDFSQLKNKMQAMGPIMKQFKGCDGNFVKDILMKV